LALPFVFLIGPLTSALPGALSSLAALFLFTAGSLALTGLALSGLSALTGLSGVLTRIMLTLVLLV